jgi:hypothetical protein
MPDEHLTWIVPCRRAVVKKTITYHNLMVKWEECLRNHKEKLKQWYGLGRSDHDFDMGKNILLAWIVQMNLEGAPADVSRTSPPQGSDGGIGGNTLNSLWPYVRLWKGPLRVLLEEKAGGTPDQSGDEIVTQITYRVGTGRRSETRTLRLVQNRSHKEVTNANAEFLMGDVVEFPIFKFLFACYKREYNEISFNPNGSFLCGTSLLKSNQPHAINAEPKIHDNLIAMRFQLFLNLLRGAFYSLSPVFGLGASNAPIAEDGGLTVYARGVVYGATWLSPTINLRNGYWRGATQGWGYVEQQDVPTNLPTRKSLNNLAGGENPPITPGIACSPASLTLSSYMLNLDRWGVNSVGTELTRVEPHGQSPGYDPTTSIYWGKFEEAPMSEGELLGEGQSENRARAREELKRKINEILQELGEPPPLACSCISDDKLQSLGRIVKNQIIRQRDRGDLGAVWTTVNEQLRQLSRRLRDSEANQRNTLWDIHRCFYQRFVNLRRQLEELKEDPAWHQAELPIPDIDVSQWPTEPHPETEEVNAQTLKHGIDDRKIDAIKNSLKKKRDEIDSGDAYRDMSDTLHDISVFTLSRHELALVKVYPFEQLMMRTSLPLSGRISAYDPLNGSEQFPEGGSSEAQLFFLEATGSLAAYTRPNGQDIQACGLGPFKWKRIENNSLYLKRKDDGLHYWANNTPRGSGTLLKSGWRISNEVLRGVYPGNEGGSGPSTTPEFKPFVVFKLGPEGGGFKLVGPLGDYQIFFADLAVPFPTFKFADEQGNFPRKNNIPTYLDKVLTEVTIDLDNANERLRTAVLTDQESRREERRRDLLEKFKKAVDRAVTSTDDEDENE